MTNPYRTQPEFKDWADLQDRVVSLEHKTTIAEQHKNAPTSPNYIRIYLVLSVLFAVQQIVLVVCNKWSADTVGVYVLVNIIWFIVTGLAHLAHMDTTPTYSRLYSKHNNASTHSIFWISTILFVLSIFLTGLLSFRGLQ